MNAAERAKGLNITTKIASVVTLFKAQFPDAKADLKPWQNDPDTLKLVDPDSIDIGFHFPGWSRRYQSNSILVQIRFYRDLGDQVEADQFKFIGVETCGFSHIGQAWKFSTIDSWQCVGECQPAQDAQKQLKLFCRQVFELFN